MENENNTVNIEGNLPPDTIHDSVNNVTYQANQTINNAEQVVDKASTLKDAMLSIIDSTVNGISSGVSFLKAEIPQVIHQLLMWEFYSNLIYGIIGVILLGITIYFSKKLFHAINDARHSDPIIWLPWGFGSIIAILISLSFAGHLMTALKVYVAPKVYLIEYAADLYNKKGERKNANQ